MGTWASRVTVTVLELKGPYAGAIRIPTTYGGNCSCKGG